MAFDPTKVTADPAVRELIQRKARIFARNSSDPAVSAEDIEQELYKEVLRRLRGCDPGRGNPVGFALLIVIHAIADMVRDRKAAKRRCRPQQLTSDLVEEIHHDRRRAESSSDADDLALDLAAALDRLPPDLRRFADALLLTGKVSDAARKLGRPRTSLYRKFKALHRFLRDQGLRAYSRASASPGAESG